MPFIDAKIVAPTSDKVYLVTSGGSYGWASYDARRMMWRQVTHFIHDPDGWWCDDADGVDPEHILKRSTSAPPPPKNLPKSKKQFELI